MKKLYTVLLSTAFFAGLPASASSAHPDGEWREIGTAKYTEDIFSILNPELKGLTWEAPMEQSQQEPEWYRIAPYAVESQVTQTYGKTDPTWIYINTADPAKVWVEDFMVFDRYELTQVVPEAGWPAGDRYATMAGNIISWPQKSLRITDIVSYEVSNSNTCLNGEMAIVVPGGENTDVWAVLGEAQFVDGIVSPLLTGAPSTVTVTVEERNDRPGYYRVTYPWSQFGEGSNPFLIDATDPGFVTVPFQDAGITHPQHGQMMMASVGATWVHDRGITKEDFISQHPEFVITLTDGKIVFPPNAVVFNFPTQNLTKFWDCETPAEAVIEIPGKASVETITIPSGIYTEEYYTLPEEFFRMW